MCFELVKRVSIYIILVTTLFAHLDFDRIHASYLQYNHWPDASVDTWWPSWSAMRYNLALVVCPPCAPLAEHYYFVFFELQAGLAEQKDLLLSHTPANSYEGVLSPDGFWWGQGGANNSNPWKKVSLIAFYLYWLPYTVLWWWLYAEDFFRGRLPWWLRALYGWWRSGGWHRSRIQERAR